jgi:hypothetical protein
VRAGSIAQLPNHVVEPAAQSEPVARADKTGGEVGSAFQVEHREMQGILQGEKALLREAKQLNSLGIFG